LKSPDRFGRPLRLICV